MKQISTLLCICLAIANHISAQTVNFHSSFDSSFVPGGNYSLVGRISNNYLLLYSDKGYPNKLVVCDKEGTVLRERTYDFMDDSSTVAVNLIPGKNMWSLVLQSVVDNKHYTQTVKLDSDGEVLKGLEKIDSTPYDKFNSAATYNMTSSRNGEYFLLYRILRGFATDRRLLINYVLLDKSANVLGSKSFFIPFDERYEVLKNIFLAPDGTVYFAVHDGALDFRMGSKLRLYKSELTSEQPTHSEVTLKEKKPIEILFDADPDNKFVAFGALYANYDTKKLAGIFTAFYNPSTNRVETIVDMPMEKDFNKEMKKLNITAGKLSAMTRLKFIRVNPDKSVTIVTEIVSRKNYTSFTGGSSQLPAGTMTGSSYATTSRSFDQMRENLYETQLPGSNAIGNSTAFSPYRPQTMPEWNRQISYFQEETLGNTRWQGSYNSNIQNNLNSAIKNSRMALKSIVFRLDKNHKLQWRNLVQNSYVPETPFTSVKTIPFNSNLSLLSYELTENDEVVLLQEIISSNGKIAEQPICTPRMPLLFYGENMLRLGEQEILTLYFDPVQHRIGLANIVW